MFPGIYLSVQSLHNPRKSRVGLRGPGKLFERKYLGVGRSSCLLSNAQPNHPPLCDEYSWEDMTREKMGAVPVLESIVTFEIQHKTRLNQRSSTDWFQRRLKDSPPRKREHVTSVIEGPVEGPKVGPSVKTRNRHDRWISDSWYHNYLERDAGPRKCQDALRDWVYCRIQPVTAHSSPLDGVHRTSCF